MKNALELRNRHVAFLASFHNPSVIFEQISLIYALPRLFVSSFTLVLPFFPTGTQERVSTSVDCRNWSENLSMFLDDMYPPAVQEGSELTGFAWCQEPCNLQKVPAILQGLTPFFLKMEAEGEVATAVTLARILSNIPLSRGGPTSLVVFDIHALQVSPVVCILCSKWNPDLTWVLTTLVVLAGALLLWWLCSPPFWKWNSSSGWRIKQTWR